MAPVGQVLISSRYQTCGFGRFHLYAALIGTWRVIWPFVEFIEFHLTCGVHKTTVSLVSQSSFLTFSHDFSPGIFGTRAITHR
jgi:hypothetical protein